MFYDRSGRLIRKVISFYSLISKHRGVRKNAVLFVLESDIPRADVTVLCVCAAFMHYCVCAWDVHAPALCVRCIHALCVCAMPATPKPEVKALSRSIIFRPCQQKELFPAIHQFKFFQLWT